MSTQVIVSSTSAMSDTSPFRSTHYELTVRKAIMCAGDLTLEAPQDLSRTHLESASYDHTVHLCRDWTVLSDALRKASLRFDIAEDDTLVPWDHSTWQPKRPVLPFEAV